MMMRRSNLSRAWPSLGRPATMGSSGRFTCARG
ncbi:hypothetical protein DSM3645_03358 [Blastopirellula marina DSM 3645]|uniref:Uncharacterized protein n=1 Tax=Blastopirellula marina DSM 3645 TaxID=314230 RepID=A3ZVY5_9BACT|nr:hypothetical protein DSM3645_03358 [Blastopirellula marina DSM 3645]